MTTGKIPTTKGLGDNNIATYQIAEDSVVKDLQRIVLSDSNGVELTPNIGSLTETAPATDTASSGLNGRLQRIAQRLTTLISGGISATVTGILMISGDTAVATTDTGNPVKIGGIAKTTNPTAVSDGQRQNALFDKLGKQVVVGSLRELKVNSATTITNSTSETTVLSAVASTFLDVYGVILVNTGATATNVAFKDSTSGTTQFNLYVPAGDTRGFMLHESAAIKQTTVNNNWTATVATATSSIQVTMLAIKNT